MKSLELMFPTPILIADIPELPIEDHDFLLNSDYHVTSGSGGMFKKTKDTYILKNRSNSKLTEWIMQQVGEFAQGALACDNKLKITQSWCLKHENEPQRVFSHAHPNSIVSGAYYVAAPPGTQNIRFHKFGQSAAPYVKWDTNEYINSQPWAWDWHEIPVQTGRLVLFPSYINHSVEGDVVNKDVRCVLSFNTWFNGPFGDADRLFELGI